MFYIELSKESGIYLICTNIPSAPVHVCMHAQSLSCVRFFAIQWTIAMLPCSWYFPGRNTEVGCHLLLQGIFLTQGWKL